MKYLIKREEKDDTFLVFTKGSIHVDDTSSMVKDIVENLKDTGYKKVLIDFSNSRVRDSYFSTYSFMSKGIADLNLPKTVKFAVLYEHDGEQHQFSENVAVNRGWSIRYFRKLPEAEYWLNLN